jgi:hypothetical protein
VSSNTRPGKLLLWLAFIALTVLLASQPSNANPSKYPEFAQQSLPDNVTPVFISVDELAKEIIAGTKPLIIDVRTAGEYREAHILGAISAPLGEFQAHMKSIPRGRPVVLY